MNIDKKTIQKIAHLARLEVTPDKEAVLIADMKRMCQTAELLSPGQAHILKSPLCSGFLWQMY